MVPSCDLVSLVGKGACKRRQGGGAAPIISRASSFSAAMSSDVASKPRGVSAGTLAAAGASVSVAVVALLRSLAAAAPASQRVPQRKNVNGEWVSFEEAEAESQVGAALSPDAPLHAPRVTPHTSPAAHVLRVLAFHTACLPPPHTPRAASSRAHAPHARSTPKAHRRSRALLSLPRHAGRARGVAGARMGLAGRVRAHRGGRARQGHAR